MSEHPASHHNGSDRPASDRQMTDRPTSDGTASDHRGTDHSGSDHSGSDHPGSDSAIRVEAVSKSFGDVKALQDVTLNAPRGRVYGLLGPNGAGKTTLVRILTTLLRPDRGRASVLGWDVARDAERVRPRIGLAGQYAAVDENLTGRENLRMVGRLYHLPTREARRRADEVLERFALVPAADRPVKTYSGGMRRRLDLGASLVGRPEVLFLDEPTTGLDPRSRLEMWGLIQELVRGGATLLLTTQYLEEADELADRIAVIDEGRLIAEGTSDELKARLARDVIEVRVGRRDQVEPARRALEGLGFGDVTIDADAMRLSLPAPEGGASLVAAVRALDGTEVELADVGLRRPSLDDVFLAITGRGSRPSGAGPTSADGTGANAGGPGANGPDGNGIAKRARRTAADVVASDRAAAGRRGAAEASPGGDGGTEGAGRPSGTERAQGSGTQRSQDSRAQRPQDSGAQHSQDSGTQRSQSSGAAPGGGAAKAPPSRKKRRGGPRKPRKGGR